MPANAPQVLFRPGDDFYRCVVCLFRIRSPGDEPVLHHHDRPEITPPVKCIGDRPAEGQARIDIGYDRDSVAQRLRDDLFSPGPVGECQDRRGMRVHDGLLIDERVHQGLDGWQLLGGLQHAHAELIRHDLIGKGRNCAQFLEICMIKADKSRRSDCFHGGTGGLDEKRVNLIAGNRSERTLEGSVAAAVHGQIRPASHQAGCIGQKRDPVPRRGAVGADERFRFGVNPDVLHDGWFFRSRKSSYACFGVMFSWTTLRTALIMATGASDWNMFLPMSTPAAPWLIAW